MVHVKFQHVLSVKSNDVAETVVNDELIEVKAKML
jgi:hypothetical protein